MDKVVHFEIPSDDIERAKTFYKSAFGWETIPVPKMDYTIVRTSKTNKDGMISERGAINGGMLKRGEIVKSPVITIEVKDISSALKKVEKKGGKVVQDKTDIEGMGYAAYIQDTEGNIIGLFQPANLYVFYHIMQIISGPKNNQKAIFAAGCFWGVQSLFDSVKGVSKTVVGYIGGKENFDYPTYKDVCSKKTGHAEAVLLEFNPHVVTYNELLGIFFANHDPTTLNMQGQDIGDQYRSAIFYINEKQMKDAALFIIAIQKKFSKPIVTQIVKAKKFFPAEDYHQKYHQKNFVVKNEKNYF